MAFALGTLWAVLAVVVLQFALGFLWYGPLFGKPWMRAMGWEALPEAELEARRSKAMPGYATSIGGSVLATLLLWILYGWAAPGAAPYTGPLLGMAIGLAGWAGFYLPGTLTSRFFEGNSWTITGVGAGYWAVCALLQGAAVGYFAG